MYNCLNWCHYKCSNVERYFFLSNNDWIRVKCCFKELPYYELVIGYDNDKSQSLPEPVDDHPEENSSIEKTTYLIMMSRLYQ